MQKLPIELNAQQEPQKPWFLTGDTLPNFRQSLESLTD